ncbi:leucine-rich melanocyte differentiation-associated protein-like [Diorhabda sublineata]|uniref:leucine-rich melanocyte differentiation-associated protein-like n=1 Tax=Diorhabda sublineata TaxID=1163346 RepID=UPI0024E152C2|nr:leucine-rich melanocyte differentiation-associated protein-like [Diorhabda sublineata]
MNNNNDFIMLPSAVTFVDNRLCYNGQNCEMIPLSLANIYGSKVESLDLSYNELVSIRGIEEFRNLKELILDNNQLTDQIVIPYLPELHTLSLNKNKIEDLPLLLSKINTNLPKLTFLSLIGNKACTNELSGNENDEKDYQRYRCYVLYHLPNLKFLDSRKVGELEKCEAKRRGKFMNVIRPCVSIPFIDVNELCYNSTTNAFNPLPRTLRNPDDYKGAYGKCQYRYSGKHSEGNRFISNKDL